MCFGVANSICSFLFGKLVQLVGRAPFIALGMLSLLACFICVQKQLIHNTKTLVNWAVKHLHLKYKLGKDKRTRRWATQELYSKLHIILIALPSKTKSSFRLKLNVEQIISLLAGVF